MLRLRSIVPLVLMFVPTVLVGCKKDEPVPTQPESATSSSGAPNPRGKLPLRNAMAPIPKIEPQAMKDYRLEVCYFGTLTLRQARDAYFASLGKDEPNEKKIPNFGMPATPPPGFVPPNLLAPPGAGSAAPGGSAKPTPAGSARVAGSAAPPVPGTPPSAMGIGARRMADLGLRAPHERNARACTVAAGLKEPAMPEVDAALKDFAPFALELSRNIAAASVYYQREEYSKDKFEKGKDLHKKLVADFAKLDELSDKLAAAINANREKNPVDMSKLDPGEKAVAQAYTDARNVIPLLVAKKLDLPAYQAAVATLEKSVAALKELGTKDPDDTWAKITTPAFDAFLKGAHDAESKLTDKAPDPFLHLPAGAKAADNKGEKSLPPDVFLQLVNTFTAIIEAKHRALSRSLIAKGQTIEPKVGGRVPMPNVHPEMPKELPNDPHAGEPHPGEQPAPEQH